MSVWSWALIGWVGLSFSAAIAMIRWGLRRRRAEKRWNSDDSGAVEGAPHAWRGGGR